MTPNIFIEPHLAHQLENAESIHVQRQAEACDRLYPGNQISVYSAQGGVVIRMMPSLTSKLNRAMGIGSTGNIDAADVDKLEAFFLQIGIGAEIHLSLFAQTPARDLLIARRYTETGLLSTYWCSPTQGMPVQHADPKIVVRRAEPSENELFIEASVAGFRDQGRDARLLSVLAELAGHRGDMLYLAIIDNEIVATAAFG